MAEWLKDSIVDPESQVRIHYVMESFLSFWESSRHCLLRCFAPDYS